MTRTTTGAATSVLRGLLCGAVAGAAGTTALNAVTYLDMAVRGRGSSSTPQEMVATIAEKAGVEIPGDEETAQNRLSGLGPIAGIMAGVGTGALVGAADSLRRLPLPVAALVAALTAMVGADAPLAATGVSDPRSWSTTDWLSDVIPHAAYGLTTAAALRLMR